MPLQHLHPLGELSGLSLEVHPSATPLATRSAPSTPLPMATHRLTLNRSGAERCMKPPCYVVCYVSLQAGIICRPALKIKPPMGMGVDRHPYYCQIRVSSVPKAAHTHSHSGGACSVGARAMTFDCMHQGRRTAFALKRPPASRYVDENVCGLPLCWSVAAVVVVGAAYVGLLWDSPLRLFLLLGSGAPAQTHPSGTPQDVSPTDFAGPISLRYQMYSQILLAFPLYVKSQDVGGQTLAQEYRSASAVRTGSHEHPCARFAYS